MEKNEGPRNIKGILHVLLMNNNTKGELGDTSADAVCTHGSLPMISNATAEDSKFPNAKSCADLKRDFENQQLWTLTKGPKAQPPGNLPNGKRGLEEEGLTKYSPNGLCRIFLSQDPRGPNHNQDLPKLLRSLAQQFYLTKALGPLPRLRSRPRLDAEDLAPSRRLSSGDIPSKMAQLLACQLGGLGNALRFPLNLECSVMITQKSHKFPTQKLLLDHELGGLLFTR
ncbi:unnamed protein product [Prunus armeniaca]|uniref:Uncharacterized protein n=1 Tax=Prunus armeniaca TaxID=36596 RepID=A0A6J5VYK9_PRUAR|nr:unnamed protein product [Prunus armeniaca]